MSLLGKVLAARNAKQQGEPPVPYTSRSSGMFGSGSSAGGGPMSQMQQVSTLFAVVDRVCTAVVDPDWTLCRIPRDPRQGGDPEIIDPAKHAAAWLWEHPNPHMTQAALIEMVQQHIELADTGDGFLVVVSRGSIPIELWPVRPDRMLEVPHPQQYLSGWIYRSPDGEKIPLGVEQVIQIKGTPDPTNPYRGMGRVQSLLRDLHGATASAEWYANFFRNSALPGGIIEVPDILTDDEFLTLRSHWQEQHQGVSNAHRVAILEHGQWKDRSYSMRDLDFSALRNLSRDQILEAWGVSRATMGMTDGVNFAAAKAAEAQFAKLLTTPRLERWKQALNTRLLPMFGSTGNGVRFDFESPVPADTEEENSDRTSRVAAVVQLLGLSTVRFDPAATLEAFGLPELPFEETEPPAPPPPPAPPAEVDEYDTTDETPPSAAATARASLPIIVNTVFDRQQDLDWGLFGGTRE